MPQIMVAFVRMARAGPLEKRKRRPAWPSARLQRPRSQSRAINRAELCGRTRRVGTTRIVGDTVCTNVLMELTRRLLPVSPPAASTDELGQGGERTLRKLRRLFRRGDDAMSPADSEARSRSSAWRDELLVQRESDLHRHLPVLDSAVGDVAPRLNDLEPPHIPD